MSIGGPLNRQLAMTIGAAAQRSDRFLDPVHPDNLHNAGDLASGAARVTWLPAASDFVSVIAGTGESTYDVPNTADQQAAAQDQQQHVSQANLALSWQRVWSASTASQVAAYVRDSSVRLDGSAQDTPLFATADRSLSRAGVLAGVSRRVANNTLKAGFEIQRLALDEDFGSLSPIKTPPKTPDSVTKCWSSTSPIPSPSKTARRRCSGPPTCRMTGRPAIG